MTTPRSFLSRFYPGDLVTPWGVLTALTLRLGPNRNSKSIGVIRTDEPCLVLAITKIPAAAQPDWSSQSILLLSPQHMGWWTHNISTDAHRYLTIVRACE